MRYYLGWLTFFSMAVYAWRNLLIPLCFLIASGAVLERPDFPKSNIPGLNAWNLLFLSLVGAFIYTYPKMESAVKMPKEVKGYLWFYFVFIIIAYLREMNDVKGIHDFVDFRGVGEYVTAKSLFIDHVFNTLKYAIPGVMCFYMANDRRSITLLMLALVALNFGLALQVATKMPIGALTDGETLQKTAIRVIDRDIGYYRSALAVLFGGSAWLIYICRDLTQNWMLRNAATVASFITVFAMALTGGRIGIGAWLVVGVVIAYYRWKFLLIIGPIVVALIVSFVPAVQERFLQGFVSTDEVYVDEVDAVSATSGRSEIWPHVVDKIFEAPFFGYGREGMLRTGLSQWIGENVGQLFTHPHNAYLTLLMDNGIILSLPILLFYYLLVTRSFSLFRDTRNKMFIVVGGGAVAMITAQLVGFVGLLFFYPYPSSISVWCMLGIALRVFDERRKALADGIDVSTLYQEDGSSPVHATEAPPPKKNGRPVFQ